ncbi:hypothetical protein GTY78_23525 [Streptomyces sp. SID4934]|uniref:hypothetical protein n=1 Tax=unclassified Streptomyces TaxID=2593676 RepID=UPI00081E3158|nr:hypothetical protein [Streptomyces sp. ScaeMP-6W]MYQ73974.1 hypothetical protein [Streptomyces sp. SID4934]SCE34378.1 hypothetical protein GA0115237_111991 [Streptomyces sp. ScaeMP-6W]
MQQSSTRMTPKTGGERARASRCEKRRRNSSGAAYAVFRRERMPVYSQFATAVTGSAAVGQGLAQSSLDDLKGRWSAALRSESPASYAWRLFTDVTAPYRTNTVRFLYENLRAEEADALLLSYRLGLSAAAGGEVMGLPPDAFELLRRTALMNANHPRGARNMSTSNA